MMQFEPTVWHVCRFCSNLELYKEFAEEAYSIAMHPSGLYVSVGFSDKLRLMNLLIDDIRTFREFPVRGCQEVTNDVTLILVFTAPWRVAHNSTSKQQCKNYRESKSDFQQ